MAARIETPARIAVTVALCLLCDLFGEQWSERACDDCGRMVMTDSAAGQPVVCHVCDLAELAWQHRECSAGHTYRSARMVADHETLAAVA